MDYYLGIDIGASSGRHILGYRKDGEIVLEEIYRFQNEIKTIHGHECWDIDHLFEEMLNGIKTCVRQGKIPQSLAIDTWGCDFVLLDKEGNRLGDAVAYRDDRTVGIMEKVFAKVPSAEIYSRTGIQFQPFNTVNQLYAMSQAKKEKEYLKVATHFLMIPDYLNYRLTGKASNEYTNASTTQMVSAVSQTWDFSLMERLGLPTAILKEFTKVGEKIGDLKSDLQRELGINIEVVQVASHDTASAYLGAKLQDEIILSSGTWSLIGCILPKPVLTDVARQYNFTNEGHVNGQYRFLKNIMGLWIIQEIRHCLDDRLSFSELMEMAEKVEAEPMLIDVNHKNYLHPKNMIAEIENDCWRRYRKKPESIGETVNIVYHSLAHSYGVAVKELEMVTGKKYNRINIVGGGCKNEYLNKLTGEYTGKEIVAGPAEATVMGNIKSQMERKRL